MLSIITKQRLPQLSLKLSALYHDNVIDHYEKPRNVGSMDKKKKNVGTGLVGAPACGDVMKLQIELNEDGSTIEKAVFKVWLFFIIIDIRLWQCHRVKFICDWVNYRHEDRRRAENQELGHRQLPQAASCQVALLNVGRISNQEGDRRCQD